MNTVKVFLMAALLTSASMTAFGQQKSAPIQPRVPSDNSAGVVNAGQTGRSEPRPWGKREEVRNKIEAVRIWRLTEALKLDAGTSARLSTMRSSFDQQRENLHRAQIQMIQNLQLAVKAPKPDESKIKTDLDNLEKNQRAMEALKINEMTGMKSILTLEQQARYVVFQHEFMNEMRGMIDTTRSCGQGGTGIRSGGTATGSSPRIFDPRFYGKGMRSGSGPGTGGGQVPGTALGQ